MPHIRLTILMTVNTWLRVTSTAVVGGTLLASTTGAVAQVIPDNTLGAESSVVTPLDLTTQLIDGGAARGSHLFHSFLEFGIPEDTGVYFADPDSISTIFSRVTGQNPSEIYGTLGVLGDADLFLLNPNGVLFGPDAELDMEGSFVGSTADSLLLPDGTEFSATNPAVLPMLDIQVEAPVGLLFEGVDSGVLVNAANLDVGENLLLASGTVVSSGELTATAGEISVVTAVGGVAPGQVNLTQTGELVDVESAPVGAAIAPEQLLVPQWSSLAGLTVENGQLQVGDSGLAVTTGDVAVRQATANAATLSAVNNLTLVESQLTTQGDFELLAQGTVQVRDSDVKPVVIAAASDLLVQGNESVDIFALNHPNSGLFSGEDMVLRSVNDVGGDAHYWTGGDFRVEQLDGQLGNLFSPYDPIIRSQGDVSFFGYQGASLHILAGGAVDIGIVNITGPDTSDESINPNSTPALANFTLSNGDPIEIDGSQRPTLDIRAGMDTSVIGEPFGTISFNPLTDIFVDSSFTPIQPPENNLTATSADITIGNVNINLPNGLVLLTNQYEPNLSSPSGDIVLEGNLDTNRFGGLGNGGDLVVDSRGNIETNGQIVTSANPALSGNGGNIKLLASNEINFNEGTNIFSAGVLGGNIDITAGKTFSIIGTDTSGQVWSASGGNDFPVIEPTPTSGEIRIQAESIVLTGGAQVRTPTFGAANAGDIKFIANGSVLIDGTDNNGFRSSVFSEVEDGATGRGGEIELQADSLTIRDGADLGTSTSSSGDAGNVILKVNETILIDGIHENDNASRVFSSVNSEATGNGGNIEINARSLNLNNGADISASTFGDGNAGTITIVTDDAVILDGREANVRSTINSRAELGSTGNAGTIEIYTGSLSALVGTLSGTSEGEGNAANIIIAAEDIVTFDGGDFRAPSGAISRSDFDSTGQGGDIAINARELNITNGASISSTTFNQGSAGTIILNISEAINVDGQFSNGFPSRIISTLVSGATGRAGDIQIFTGSLIISNGAQILTQTSGDGNAGNIVINANERLLISGQGRANSQGGFSNVAFPSVISSSVLNTAQGDGGDVQIITGRLELLDGSAIVANTLGDGDAGNLFIDANNFLVDRGGLQSITASSGEAGDIILTVQENLVLTGIESGILASTRQNSSGDGGLIFIIADDILLENSARIAVDSEGAGIGGDIEVQSGSLRLDNNALVSSETANSNGGNIDIILQNVLLLRNGSNISTNAGRSLGTGDGGNIDITADFIIAVPEENSDITANASDGNGGNVNIRTQGLFGIEFRDEPTALSDITASSEFGLDGNVNVDTLETDPTGALGNLPEDTANTGIQESCQANNGQASVSFFDIGRSGAPTSPDDLLGANPITESWTTIEDEVTREVDTPEFINESSTDDNISLLSNKKPQPQLVISCH